MYFCYPPQRLIFLLILLTFIFSLTNLWSSHSQYLAFPLLLHQCVQPSPCSTHLATFISLNLAAEIALKTQTNKKTRPTGDITKKINTKSLPEIDTPVIATPTNTYSVIQQLLSWSVNEPSKEPWTVSHNAHNSRFNCKRCLGIHLPGGELGRQIGNQDFCYGGFGYQGGTEELSEFIPKRPWSFKRSCKLYSLITLSRRLDTDDDILHENVDIVSNGSSSIFFHPGSGAIARVGTIGIRLIKRRP